MSFRAVLVALAAPALLSAQSAPSSQGGAAAADPTVWTIDRNHSSIEFTIRHFMSKVRGTFREWRGTIIMPDPGHWESARVDVAITTASIFTDNEKRDADLRSSDFFSADSFPAITFRSLRIERSGDSGKIYGDLTMHGVTRAVVLEGKFLGTAPFPNNVQRLGFEATATIDRTQFGVTWNRVVEGAGVTLGDEVTIDIAVEATRRKPAT